MVDDFVIARNTEGRVLVAIRGALADRHPRDRPESPRHLAADGQGVLPSGPRVARRRRDHRTRACHLVRPPRGRHRSRAGSQPGEPVAVRVRVSPAIVAEGLAEARSGFPRCRSCSARRGRWPKNGPIGSLVRPWLTASPMTRLRSSPTRSHLAHRWLPLPPPPRRSGPGRSPRDSILLRRVDFDQRSPPRSMPRSVTIQRDVGQCPDPRRTSLSPSRHRGSLSHSPRFRGSD